MMQRPPAPRAPVAKSELAYAGFWLRLLAYLIDSVLLGAVGAVITAGVLVLDPGDLRAVVNASLIAAALGWAYFALLESSPARATLGKLALDLTVSDLSGDPISFRRATARYFLKTLSTVFLMVGWLMAAFTPKKQALHDLLAGTLVVRKVTYLVIGEEPPTEPGEYWDGSRWIASIQPPLSMENQ